MTDVLDGGLADTAIESGTNVLVAGPPLSGKRRLGQRILQRGMANDEGAIVISARDTAERVRELFGLPADDPDDLLGVVDCVTEHVGRAPSETDLVRYAASPSDMTGVGIKFAEFVEYFNCERDVERNRVLLNSITTLLQYSSLQTVFRFLHALTTRVTEVDAVGVAVVESTVHDAETMATIRELFDGVVETTRDGSYSVDLPAAARRRGTAEP